MRQAGRHATDHSAGTRPGLRTSRRTFLAVAGVGALATTAGQTLAGPARNTFAQDSGTETLGVSPAHVTWTASPHTEISFRGVTEEQLGVVTVLGRQSGGHSGLLIPHSDGNGASFVPDARFEPGEVVEVRAAVDLGPTDDGSLLFGVVQPAEIAPSPTSRTTDNPDAPTHTLQSRPDLRPPLMEITTRAEEIGEGYIFVGSRGNDSQAGAMILDNSGEIIWFNPPDNDLNEHHDVRAQEFNGEPVVTFAEANGPRGYRLGHYVILDNSYQRIAEVQIGNGYTGGDHHEFLLTQQGTAMIGSYHPVIWDLSPVGGSKYGVVLDGVVQEVEIETGRVRFEWHSLDHIAVEESYHPLPSEGDEPYDYFHQNSIGIGPDGNIVVSARHTFAIYKFDGITGEIMWRLNGKQSDFTMEDGTPFSYQHDARLHDKGELTLFDNAATNPDEDDTTDSRGLVLALDEETMTATLVQEYIHPNGILSTSQGNTQVLPNGNVFIGWGSAPVFSEFDSDGEIVFNGRFPDSATSYRAYRMPWTGQPSDPPDVAVESGEGTSVTVYASWNGATEVASWQVLAGPDPDQMDPVESAPKDGFETEITVDTTEAYIAVQALDASSNVLGTSEAIQTAS